MDNFSFLKSVDKDLYEIILDAEKLYRDEYFEQCIGQTRRFGEVVCKNVLGAARTTEKTFDDMLATLKDKATTVIQEQEFVEDLYFLKREGNSSVHATSVKKDGILALECLQRAFEVAISYAVYYKKQNKTLLKLLYDTELLLTGCKAKKSLSEKYLEGKSKSKKIRKAKGKKRTIVVSKTDKNFSVFSFLVFCSSIISIVLVLTIFLLSFVS